MLIVSNNHPYSQRNGNNFYETTIPTQSRQLNAPSGSRFAKTHDLRNAVSFFVSIESGIPNTCTCGCLTGPVIDIVVMIQGDARRYRRMDVAVVSKIDR